MQACPHHKRRQPHQMLPAAMGKKCKKSSNCPNLKKAGRLVVETAINSS
ncbi:MAG: hypothetical protein MUC60_13890 [Oscillatoria sp. Prado101]|nr:hypothetical protein [Oscillatoria sp. Prado101]